MGGYCTMMHMLGNFKVALIQGCPRFSGVGLKRYHRTVIKININMNRVTHCRCVLLRL